MSKPWSAEWVAAIDGVARADESLIAASRGMRAVIGQEVVDGTQTHRWHIVLDDGSVAVRAGWPEKAPDVTFSQSAEVADLVASGAMAARTAFVLGHIRLGGDPSVLLAVSPALAGLGDLFAAVRVPPSPDPTAATGSAAAPPETANIEAGPESAASKED